MNRSEWAQKRSAWTRAIETAAHDIATENSGQGEPLYRLLGSAAWGRFSGEPCVSDTKDNTIFGCGYLQGIRDATMRAGREFGLKGTKHLERIYDRLREQEQEG